MERDWLEARLAAGRSIESVAKEVGKHPSTVGYWVKKHGLDTRRAAQLLERGSATPGDDGVITAECGRHGMTRFGLRGDGGFRCLACRSEAVVARRRFVKATLVAEAGGRCVLCGYDRSVAALQFHHLDPTTKAFHISRQGVTRSLARARAEAAKCALLCANCHAEVESGVATIPPGAPGSPG